MSNANYPESVSVAGMSGSTNADEGPISVADPARSIKGVFILSPILRWNGFDQG